MRADSVGVEAFVRPIRPIGQSPVADKVGRAPSIPERRPRTDREQAQLLEKGHLLLEATARVGELSLLT
jgi:hypothetical protein